MVASRLDREKSREAYFAVLTTIAAELPEHQHRALLADDLDPARRGAVEVLLPHSLRNVSTALAAAIEDGVEGTNAWYAWDAIDGSLETCLLFASWHQLLIRPFIAPTLAQDEFVAAGQRVYLSATLGSGGELERSFGRTRISRIPQPADWDREGSGRRYMLSPGAGRSGEEANQLIREIVQKVDRVLVLAPSDWRLQQLSGVLLPDGYSELGPRDIERSLDAFTDAQKVALLLANRYDGIDLPHEACRLIVLTGLPSGTHLQERFLFDELGARHVLAERIRTRITQGAGRATRARRDTAVVILHGDDLIGFLSQSEVQLVLRSELQAELELALTNSALPAAQVLDSVDSFLAQDGNWQPTEEWLRSTAEERPREAAPGAANLAESAEHEISAWEAAWRGDYAAAVESAQRAVAALNHPATANYRAWWQALAASWSILDRGESDGRTVELVRQAGLATRRMRWRASLPTAPPVTSTDDALLLRAEAAVQWLRRRVGSPKLERDLTTLEERITQAEAAPFELGLELLGALLGFDSKRPAQTADPDGAWRDGAKLWLLFEAKTEENADSPLSATEVRQANSHKNWIRQHFAWPDPDRVVTVLVVPKTELHQDAVGIADDDLYLASPDTIREIASKTIAAHRELASEIVGLSDGDSTQRMAAWFSTLGLSTDDLVHLLTLNRLGE